MTLANKTSCKENPFKRHTRSEGFEFLYVSQMKNNDREFDIVIERLRKNIPQSQIDGYALKRTKSNQMFRDHNEVPFTQQPDNFFYQNKKDSKCKDNEKTKLQKYVETPDKSESFVSLPCKIKEKGKSLKREDTVESKHSVCMFLASKSV
jgi:hypothetical protein